MSQLNFKYLGERKKGAKKPKLLRKKEGYASRPVRRNTTPNQIATYSLSRALEKFPEQVSKELRDSWIKEFKSMEQLKYMHMPHFAIALILVNQYSYDLFENPETEKVRRIFSDAIIDPLLEKIINVRDLTPREKIAHKEVLLTYIRRIAIFRNPEYVDENIYQDEIEEEEGVPQDIAEETSPLLSESSEITSAPGLPTFEREVEEEVVSTPKVDLESGSQTRIPISNPDVVPARRAKITVSFPPNGEVIEESPIPDSEEGFESPSYSGSEEISPSEFESATLEEFKVSTQPASAIALPQGSPNLLPISLQSKPKIVIRKP